MGQAKRPKPRKSAVPNLVKWIVAAGVNRLRSPDRAIVLVTHYQRLLDHIVPDFVHVLLDGRIVKSGGKDLALELEEKGYDWVTGASPAGAAA